MEKRASEKYYIIMSLILGLIVLSLVLYFIFHEYFTRDELDWQECRQSIYLRSISPEIKKAGVTLADLKNTFPLKCKTEVVTIDTAKPEVVYGKISDTIAAGWFLFGEGEYDIVPREFLGFEDSKYCMVFARISYTDKSIKEFSNFNEDLGDDKRKLLDKMGADYYFETEFRKYYTTTKMKNSQKNYYDYLHLAYPGGPKINNFVLYNPSSMKFYPNEKGLLFVYQITKYPSVGVWNILNYLFGGREYSPDEIYKIIYLVRPEDLGEIGCTEFITIPS